MIILDTSVWVEFLKMHEPYFTVISPLLEEKDVLALECVFGELLQGVKNIKEQNVILKYWKHLSKIDIPEIIIEAGKYSSKNKLLDKGVGLIDAIILMHGIKLKTKIWTIDRKFLAVIPENIKYKTELDILEDNS
jgi:predicted nucleic acid-binding protein